MIKINLLGDALAQGGAKKGASKAAAEPVQDYTGEGGRRSRLPIAGLVVGLAIAACGGIYYVWLNSLLTKAEKQKAELERDKKQYEPYIALEKTFREKKAALQKKEEVMTTLKRQQSLPVHLLEEMVVEVDALSAHLGRPLTLIAESDLNDPVLVTPREAGGYGLDAQWSDDFHHAVHVALTREVEGYYADFEPLVEDLR